ncbi:MAG: DUF7118 family protein [Halobacteriota archaeon]
MTSADEDLDTILDRLSKARAEALDAEAAPGELDAGAARELKEASRLAHDLLDSYEDRATGSGDFGGYLEFRQRFDAFVEGLDADLPHRGRFEQAAADVDRRRLSGSDFDAARRELEPIEPVVEALDTLDDARDRLSSARRAVLDRRARLEERRARLEELASLDPSALDAPVDELRDLVDTYNESVASDHHRLLHDEPVRSVLEMYEHLSYFALLDIDAPPDPLVAFMAEHPAGTEPVATVLEYLSFSRSKLEHYVDDAGHFLAEVRPHSPYLERLAPDPFQVDWPPPERDVFRWELRELGQAVSRFGTESTVADLRRLESLCRTGGRYERQRSSAVLHEDLDEDERDLVRTGSVHDELEAVRGTIEKIEGHLDRAT